MRRCSELFQQAIRLRIESLELLGPALPYWPAWRLLGSVVRKEFVENALGAGRQTPEQ